MTRCNSPEGGVIYTKEAETAAEVSLLIVRIMVVIMLIKMDDKGENFYKRDKTDIYAKYQPTKVQKRVSNSGIIWVAKLLL